MELSATLPIEKCWELIKKVLNLSVEIIDRIWTRRMQKTYPWHLMKYTGQAFRARILFMKSLGRTAHAGQFEASVSLIRDEDGKITGFRSVNRDITERQKAEKRIGRTAFPSRGNIQERKRRDHHV